MRWKIGDVTITRVLEMEMPVPYHPEQAFLKQATPEALRSMPWLYPHFVTEDGALRLSIHALLVDAPGIRLVVDTCFGNDKPRGLLGNQPLQTGFLNSLQEAGWATDSVDAVVCTHLHVDHVGWNTMLVDGKWIPTFPKAKYLIGRQEYAHWTAEGDEEQQAILSDSVKPVFDHGLAQLVEMDHVISPEIRLTPTPGHTPGHVSVLIESRGERAMITGDMLHHPCQFGHPEWSPSFDSDPVKGASTRQGMMNKVADEPILVIGTHFAAPTAGHVRRDGNAFRFDVG
ncbi:MAG: MBL fold metallo-hydrolase [Pseudomonadales bacterium]|nr:MBL fold metallo-hydrolase [Pseudomonadales bacterium]MCP5182343.1 MBL fold metallo-hydrolase [Pseudomonadales bacterium]